MALDPLGLWIFLGGIALLLLELTQPGYYIGVGGTVGVIVGLVQLSWPQFLTSWWSPFIVTVVALAATGASIVFYRKFAPPARAPETFSSDQLVGQVGKVVTQVEPDSLVGKVKISGLVWSAEASETIPAGAEVVVRRVEGVHVVVEPVKKPGAE